MKHRFSSRRSLSNSGFTLVELLVVIGIIAILAGVLLSAGTSAIRAAKRASAANTASQIQVACTSYYTEYGVYPIPSTSAGTDYNITDGDEGSWGTLICALSGNINPTTGAATTGNIANTRGISYLSFKASDVSAAGAPKNPLPYDPAGHPYYNLAMDGDYNNLLNGLPNFTGVSMGSDPPLNATSTAGVAVWANCNPNTTTKNPGFWVHTY